MGRFDSKVQALEKFIQNRDTNVINSVVPYQVSIVQANKDRLFKLGEYASGGMIKPQYKPLTIRLKRQKGQPTDRVTLKDTGDFHGSIYVRFELDRFIVMADDPKTTKIMRKYGKGTILGMSEKDLADLLEKVYPTLLNRFKKAAYA